MKPEEILCVLDAHKDNKSDKLLIIFNTEREEKRYKKSLFNWRKWKW